MGGVAAGMVVGGKYRLEEPIGRGGMASIWRATHTTLESSVAVKFLETFGSSREKMTKRFLREAKLAGNLKHRNVVHILDFGVMEDGQPYMVMELLRGKSLQDRFDDGPPLSELELFEVASKVLSGLAAVHDAGIVHRDIKPDNIFLVNDSDGDYPKLLDFGISRGVELAEGDTRVTNTGAVMGTPLYMSPEQARGLKDVDARTDLWSVGMILWEGLCGDLPFDAEHTGDVLIRVATEDAPSIARERPDLPDEAVEAVMKAIKRDRSERFASAREMREAVRLAAEAIAASQGTDRRATRDSIGPTRAQKEISTREIVIGSAQPARPPTRWPLIAGGAALATVVTVVVAFIALGGEIRFSSAAAEPGEPSVTTPTAQPPAPVESEPEEPEEPIAAPAPEPALQEPAAPIEPAPQVAAPEPTGQDAEGSEPRTPRRGRPARPRGASREAATAQRTPAQGTTAQGTSAQPTRPRTEEPARPPQQQEGGRSGFLRDLDY